MSKIDMKSQSFKKLGASPQVLISNENGAIFYMTANDYNLQLLFTEVEVNTGGCLLSHEAAREKYPPLSPPPR